MQRLLGLPDLASAHGGALDALTGWVHLLMVVMFVGWGVFFAFALVRFRRGRNPVARYEGVRGRAARWVEWGVIAAEGLLLTAFSIPLWSQRVDDFPSADRAMVVRVVAEQYAWNIHYPGPDGRFGRADVRFVDPQTNPLGLDPNDPAGKDDVTTINQLHLPVGKPAIIQLTSKDVIHSFDLPEMRVKQDAIPGITTPLWFVPTVTTSEMRKRKRNPQFNYEIACAQLCGLGHYRMRGFLTVETQQELDHWLAEHAPAKEETDSFWQ